MKPARDVPELDRLIRAVKRLASQRTSYGLDFDDLVGEGNLAVVEAMQTYRPGASPWHWYATRAARRGMWNAIRRESRRPVLDVFEADPAAGQSPEPRGWLVGLLSCLTDLEAESLVLTCGLDGGEARTMDQVAHMTGRNRITTRRRYLSALAKLRSAVAERSDAAFTITP